MSQPTTQTNDQGIGPWRPNNAIIAEQTSSMQSTTAVATSPGDGDHGLHDYPDRNHVQDQQEDISSEPRTIKDPQHVPQSPRRVRVEDPSDNSAHEKAKLRRYRSESCSPEVPNRVNQVPKEGEPPATFKSPTRSLMDSRASFGPTIRPRTRSNPKPHPWKDSDHLVSEEEPAARQSLVSGKSSSLESPSKGHPPHHHQAPTKTTSRSLEEKTAQDHNTRLAQEVIGKDHKILSSKEREVMLKELSGQSGGSFAALEEPVPMARPTTLRQRRLMFSHLTASVDVDTREKPSTPPYMTAALATSEDTLLSEVLQASHLASSLEQLTGVARKTLRRRGLIPLQAIGNHTSQR
ncbi:unnamed protein product [Ixodes hexagonus]